MKEKKVFKKFFKMGAVLLLSAFCLLSSKNPAVKAAKVTDTVTTYVNGINWSANVYDDGTVTIRPKNAGEPSGPVAIPDTVGDYQVNKLDNDAFRGNGNITRVKIPAGITAVGSNAFYRCSSLTCIAVDDNNSAFMSYGGALLSKDKTTIYTVPGGMSGNFIAPYAATQIERGAFNECSKLTEVTLRYGVKSIGAYAFCDCTSLAKVNIPSSVSYLGQAAFMGCSSLLSLSIPGGVGTIPDFTCSGCSSLTDVTIADGVWQIGTCAFQCDANIKHVTFSSNMSVIQSSAFYGCSSIEEITIPSKVGTIEANVFQGCRSLKTVYIPDNVSYLDHLAFYDCFGLQSIRLPKNIKTSIYVFTKCPNITDVYYAGTEAEWKNMTIASDYPDTIGKAAMHYNCD